MILHSRGEKKSKLFRHCGFPGGLVLLLAILMSLYVSEVLYETKPASAHSHLGILGRRAPELNLNNWIGADGKPRAPIQLSRFNSGARRPSMPRWEWADAGLVS